MSVIKMYDDASSATYSSVDITIPRDGTLYGLDLAMLIGDPGPASNESCFAELSFADTPHYSTNYFVGSLAQVMAGTFFADAARIAVHGAERMTLTGLAIPVYSGEKIYLHITPAASISATVVAYLFIQDGLR